MTTATADLTDLLDNSGLPWYVSNHGVPSLTTPDEEYTIRIVEDDGTYRLVVLSGGAAELVHTEALFSGVAAQAALLATIDTLIAELA